MKALNAYAAYLAARNSEDQEQIAAQLAVSLFPLWQIMTFRELDASTVLWLPAVLPRIRTAFLQAQRVQAVFTQNVRFATLPTEDPLPIRLPDVENPLTLSPGAFELPEVTLDPGVEPMPIFDEFDEAHVAESLTIEANYKTKKQMPGPEEELMQKALVRSSGEAVRQALDGSRGVSENIRRRDRRVLGYARVTDSDPCSFCALLASHGLFYSADAFARNNPRRKRGRKSDADFIANPNARKDLPEKWLDVAKVHNNCRCTLRPVYSKAMGMDDAAKHWLKGWTKVTEANPFLSNDEHLALFKQWHAQNPYQGTQFDLHALEADLADRRDSLLDAGFSPDSPQVKWAERSRRNLAA